MTNTASSVLRFGAFEADLATGELRRNGRTVKLQPQPFRVLALLVERHGQLVAREQIHQTLWGADPPADFEHALNFAIKKIRDALGDDAEHPRYIETLSRRGYRFIAAVERAGKASAPGVSPAKVPESNGTSTPEQLWSSHRPIGVPDEGASAVAVTVAANIDVAPPDGTEVDLDRGIVVPHAAPEVPAARSRWWMLSWVGVVAFTAAAGGYLYIHSRSVPKLTDRDTVVLAEFTNTTRDPVFDGTLRQGLSAQLEQSPFLNLLSDTRIAETLALMAQPRDARLTQKRAREVCQRTASAATIEGSIASLGSQYVLGLTAVNCHNGDTLATEQVTASGKEQVLKALGEAATKLRQKLGESLASVEKYDAPPESVTTPSLEALRAYSLGSRAWDVNGNVAAAIPSFEQAISLDPNFAMAYAQLGPGYSNMGETARAAEGVRKAYELRGRVSERERFYIESQYHLYVTGDLEAARKVDELWAQTYPRDPIPRTDLVSISAFLGENDKALAATEEISRLEPDSGIVYATLVIRNLALYRLDQARAAAREAQARKLDSPVIHVNLYLADFLGHDAAGMEREAAGLAGKPGWEDIALCYQSDTAAYAGQFIKARELTRRAAESAERVGEQEEAAGYEAEAAVREALVGNPRLAKQQANRAVALSNGRDVEAISAIALGLGGDSRQATRLADDLNQRFPKGTIVQAEYLPMIRAATFLGGRDSSKQAGKAVQALAAAAPYEEGDTSQTLDFALYPAYLRGEAYLAANEAVAASAEFQKIVDLPGVVLNEPIGALAHLGLARALEAGIDVAPGSSPAHATLKRGASPEALAKARIAYQDFLALWKDADPDIPILKQAKAEYVRLQ